MNKLQINDNGDQASDYNIISYHHFQNSKTWALNMHSQKPFIIRIYIYFHSIFI